MFNPAKWYDYGSVPFRIPRYKEYDIKYLFFMNKRYLDYRDSVQAILIPFNVARYSFFLRDAFPNKGREAIVITYSIIHRIRSFQRLWKNRRQRFRNRLISHRLNKKPSLFKTILFDNIPLFDYFLTFRYGR